MSNITLNIVEPGSAPVVPDTGLFTAGIGGPEATIITAVSTVLLLTIVAVVVAMLYKKHKKQGKVTKLVSTVDACATVVKSKKRVNAGLAAVALLVSAGTFAGLLVNAGKSNTNATEGEDDLTLDVSSEDLTIEVGDEPVFAVLPVELTVEEATQAGYTLTAYTDNTDLVSTTDSSKVIPMVTVDEGELAVLTDNTYGLALAEPASQAEEVYTTLSTDADNPTFITDKDHKATEAGDTTTIYYGLYITPDVPYGTYTGSDIYYDVEENYITDLSFDGNGSDGGVDMEGMTLLAGDTITLPENTYTRAGYSFTGWNTAADGTGKAYADEAEFTATEGVTEDITLYAQWALPVIGDLTEMQDFAKLTEAGKASVLASMTPGQQYQLKDNRDQTMYYIAKLADGNVWMTQNLDFDIVKGGADLDHTNTDVPDNWNDAGKLANTYTTGTTTWNSSTTTPESYDPGDLYWNGAFTYDKETCEANGGWWYKPQYQPGECRNANPTASIGDIHYHIGNYYNWTAAVAMSDSSGKNSGDMNQSICPAGWRLPNNSDNKSYQNLVNTQGLTAGTSGNIQNTPVYFVYGGIWYGSSNYVGNYGGYWSSVVNNSNYACLLYFDVNGSLDPQYGNYRRDGYSLRCVAR